MTIYSFWIFDRHTNCIYSREWTQLSESPLPTGSINSKSNLDSAQLLFGALFSLRNLATKLGNSDNKLHSFSTAKYRAHFMETASGLKFCLLTDLSLQHLQPVLNHIYANIFVEYIAKNPLSPIDFDANSKITNQIFIKKLDKYIATI